MVAQMSRVCLLTEREGALAATASSPTPPCPVEPRGGSLAGSRGPPGPCCPRSEAGRPCS